jgi:hypothetical protein
VGRGDTRVVENGGEKRNILSLIRRRRRNFQRLVPGTMERADPRSLRSS